MSQSNLKISVDADSFGKNAEKAQDIADTMAGSDIAKGLPAGTTVNMLQNDAKLEADYKAAGGKGRVNAGTAQTGANSFNVYIHSRVFGRSGAIRRSIGIHELSHVQTIPQGIGRVGGEIAALQAQLNTGAATGISGGFWSTIRYSGYRSGIRNKIRRLGGQPQ